MEIIIFYIWVVVLMFLLCERADNDIWYGTPKYFLQVSQMNLFGVIICSILMFFIGFPIYILLFIYWLCHVHIKKKSYWNSRKEDK